MCKLPNSDDNLLVKIKKTHEKNKKFKAKSSNSNTFSIIHTAKEVEYTITNFLQKNKDEISANIT